MSVLEISALLVVGSDVRYIGCYTEMADDNDLDGYNETFTGTNTIGKCITTCKMKGKLFLFANFSTASTYIFLINCSHRLCAS